MIDGHPCPPAARTIDCGHGPACTGDHHGWDCPLSDPTGDVLRTMADPLPNPILEEARRQMLHMIIKGEPTHE